MNDDNGKFKFRGREIDWIWFDELDPDSDEAAELIDEVMNEETIN